MRSPALVLLATLLAGCTTTPPGGDIDCGALEAEPDSESANIGPDKIHELEYGLEPGQTLHWRWCVSTGTEQEFNVHRHVDDDVVYEVQETAAIGNGALEIDEADTYFPMWQNPDREWATVVYRISVT